jgi:hypothetical protein
MAKKGPRLGTLIVVFWDLPAKGVIARDGPMGVNLGA